MTSLVELENFDFLSIAGKLERSLPETFLSTHPRFVRFAICGMLFRHGIEDPDLVRTVSGEPIENVVLGIASILADPEASVRYFAALDQLDSDGGLLR